MSADDLQAGPVTLPGWALTEVFILTGGPGGQNVNKTASGVQLRFNLAACPGLSEAQQRRIVKRAGSRATKAGEVVIEATRFRRQEQNRADARERLADLVADALKPPPPSRKKTRPTRGSVERRLKSKAERGQIKRMRGKPAGSD